MNAMHDYAANIYEVDETGNRTPFSMSVLKPVCERPEIFSVLVSCPVLNEPKKIFGTTPEIAYAYGFSFLKTITHRPNRKLVDENGVLFAFPTGAPYDIPADLKNHLDQVGVILA